MVNNYLLIVLGLMMTLIIGIITGSFILMTIWSVIFWLWFNNKKTYTKEDLEEEEDIESNNGLPYIDNPYGDDGE